MRRAAQAKPGKGGWVPHKPSSPPAPTLGQLKRERVLAALDGREPDRVPMGEFFWSAFVERCQKELANHQSFDPYRHWDLDLVVLTPNMDPKVQPVTIVQDQPERTLVRTGFGATIALRAGCPMPAFLDFDTKTLAQAEALVFDAAADERRYFAAIPDQINAVGDVLNLRVPAFVERVKAYAEDFCVFGSVCEPYEFTWRLLGPENLLCLIASEPARLGRFFERVGEFLVGIVEAQIAAAEGKLAGLYLWGDVAYRRGMLFRPEYWREALRAPLERLCAAVHAAGLKVIYHGCGNAQRIYPDLLQAGVDAYNPLEAKAGLDVVELKRQYQARWAFNGNIDVRVLAANDPAALRAEVLRKLNAAKGGGYIVQSDHSVPGDVAPATYDYFVRLVREHGTYPLKLGEFDLDPKTANTA